MSEYCESDVRREALDVSERVERPDLCDVERAEGGMQEGVRGTSRTYEGTLASLNTPLCYMCSTK